LVRRPGRDLGRSADAAAATDQAAALGLTDQLAMALAGHVEEEVRVHAITVAI
jgi:hypothetical protein